MKTAHSCGGRISGISIFQPHFVFSFVLAGPSHIFILIFCMSGMDYLNNNKLEKPPPVFVLRVSHAQVDISVQLFYCLTSAQCVIFVYKLVDLFCLGFNAWLISRVLQTLLSW